jgi:hypothetical protein
MQWHFRSVRVAKVPEEQFASVRRTGCLLVDVFAFMFDVNPAFRLSSDKDADSFAYFVLWSLAAYPLAALDNRTTVPTGATGYLR